MASPTLLIVGRGRVAVLAARLAAVRGYVPTLSESRAVVGPSLFLGGPEGLLPLLEAESGYSLGMDQMDATPGLPKLLYLGSLHRLVGCLLAGAVSPEEAERFFPGREILQTALSPELDGRILLSYRKTSVRTPLGQRILDWFLEPERQKESLPRAIRKKAAPLLPPWTEFLEDIRPFSGLSGKKLDNPESLRLLVHLVESRGRVLAGSGAPLEIEGVEILPAGVALPEIEKAKKGRGYALAGQDRTFDRVLALTAPPDRPLASARCALLPGRISPLWPSSLLLREDPGNVSFLIRGEKEAARLTIVPKGGADLREEFGGWVERWNRESLFPFLDPDSLEIVTPAPGTLFAPNHAPSLREETPFLSRAGHYAEMVDPTCLPVVPEDFWADLSLAIPSLVAPMRP
jgi:hypothetical protein